MVHPHSQHRLALHRPMVAAALIGGTLVAAGCSTSDEPVARDPTASAAPGTTTTTPAEPAVVGTTDRPPGPPATAAPERSRPPLPRDPVLGDAIDRGIDQLPAGHVPVPWTDLPERPELTGPLAVNELLTTAPVIGADVLTGAEDVAIGLDGAAYTGTADGAIWRLPPPATPQAAPEKVATVPGRPLGIDAYDDRTLVVASAGAGLVAVDTATGESWVLANQIDGDLVFFADAPAVAADGTIYVTEASTVYRTGFPTDFLDGRPNGRLLRYEPTTGELAVLADGFYFANGIVVDPDETYVLVAESFRFRITKVGLDDPQNDRTQFGPPLINGADNLHWDEHGQLWVGGSNLRDDSVDAVLAGSELRAQLAALPPGEIAASRAPYGFAQVLDRDGRPVASFHDPTGSFSAVSAANVLDGHVYFATLSDDGVAVLPVPADAR